VYFEASKEQKNQFEDNIRLSMLAYQQQRGSVRILGCLGRLKMETKKKVIMGN
jgi:hypothetical protein